VRIRIYIWIKSMELEYGRLRYITKRGHQIYVTAFSYVILIESFTFARVMYPFVASIINPTAEMGLEIRGARGVWMSPYRTPLINTVLLLYISASCNLALRKVNTRNIRRGIL